MNEIRCPECDRTTEEALNIAMHNPDDLPGHEWLEITCECGHTYAY